MKATGAAGMNIINNNEETAGQTGFHAHVHLVPRFADSDEFDIRFIQHEPDFTRLGQLAEDIQKEIEA